MDTNSIVVSPVRSTWLEPDLRTAWSLSHAGHALFFSRQAPVASTLKLACVRQDWRIRAVSSCVLDCGGAGTVAAARLSLVARLVSRSSGGSNDSQFSLQSQMDDSRPPVFGTAATLIRAGRPIVPVPFMLSFTLSLPVTSIGGPQQHPPGSACLGVYVCVGMYMSLYMC